MADHPTMASLMGTDVAAPCLHCLCLLTLETFWADRNYPCPCCEGMNVYPFCSTCPECGEYVAFYVGHVQAPMAEPHLQGPGFPKDAGETRDVRLEWAASVVEGTCPRCFTHVHVCARCRWMAAKS